MDEVLNGQNCVKDENNFQNSQQNNNNTRHSQDKLTKRAIYKRLLVLAIPIAIQNLMTALLNIVDSVMMQSLSKEAMGAVTLVNQFIFIYQVIIFAVAGVSVIFISQFWGKGQKENISMVFGFASILVAILSAVFCSMSLIFPREILQFFFNPEDMNVLNEAVKFLQTVAWGFIPFGFSILIMMCVRGMGRVRMALFVSIGVIGVNFFFNYCFMFGNFGFPSLGIAGAAVGTVIARSSELVVVVFLTFVLKYGLFGKLKYMYRFHASFVKKFIKLLIPATANELFWVIGTTIFMMVFAQLPNSDDVLASVSIVKAVDNIIFVVLIGLGNAVGVVVGNEIGGRDEEKARYVSKLALRFAFFTGVVCMIVMSLSTLLVPVIYGNLGDQEVYFHAQMLILVFASVLPARAICFTLIVGILRAGGDALFCMLCEMITMWGLAVPLVLIFGLVVQAPIELLYSLVMIEEVIKMFIALRRFRKGNWLRNMVKDEKSALSEADVGV